MSSIRESHRCLHWHLRCPETISYSSTQSAPWPPSLRQASISSASHCLPGQSPEIQTPSHPCLLRCHPITACLPDSAAIPGTPAIPHGRRLVLRVLPLGHSRVCLSASPLGNSHRHYPTMGHEQAVSEKLPHHQNLKPQFCRGKMFGFHQVVYCRLLQV